MRWWGVKGGQRVEGFDTDKGKIAIAVCYDIEFPEITRIDSLENRVKSEAKVTPAS